MKQKNEPLNKFLPVWVWAIVLVQLFLVLFFSAGTAMNPGNFIPDVSELNYVTQLYITRNVTIVLGLALVLCIRSHKALLTIFVVRLLTDLADIMTVYAFNVEAIKSSVPMVVVLLVIPALLVIGYLWKGIKEEERCFS